MYVTSKKFLNTNATIAAATTITPTSNVFNMKDAANASITLYVKGASGATGTVVFKFVAYNPVLAAWDTNPFKILNITMNGTNDIYETFVIPVGIDSIKLASIQNLDATYAVAACNAALFKQGFDDVTRS